MYRLQRRSTDQPRAVRGVDPPAERRLLACDPGTPTGWARLPHQPGTMLFGIDRSRIDYLHRADGFRQLTIDGCPIYQRADDTAHDPSRIHDNAGTWVVVE